MNRPLPLSDKLAENRIPPGVPGGFFVYSAQSSEEILYADQNVIELFGCKDIEELRQHTGNSFRGMVHPEDLERVERSIQAQTVHTDRRHDYVRYRILTKQGTCRYVEDFGHLVKDADGMIYFYVFIIDVNKAEYERREQISSAELQIFWDNRKVDWLTGLLNMEAFRERTESYLCMGNSGEDHPFTIAVFDILGLGEINRNLGHAEGDKRICSLVEVVRKRMPEGCLVFRGHEADIIAVCKDRKEKEVINDVVMVADIFEGNILLGVGEGCVKAGMNAAKEVHKALSDAQLDLNIKKMMTTKSYRSQALNTLIRALEEVDPETEEHVQRTQKLGLALGYRIGLSDCQLSLLQLLCLLHDIGKIGIPLEILNKPGRLTDAEWSVLRSHPEKGYQIAMSNDELVPLADMILYHHERWDGRGYPAGLSQEDIPILSRIISIVDAYDAMVNDRCYRKALSPETAKKEILDNSGTQFDPHLAAAFLELLEENPSLAYGEKTGRDEVRVFDSSDVEENLTGSTRPVLFSHYTLDMDDVIIDIDDSFTALTGYLRDEVVGRMSQFDLIPEAELEHYAEQVKRQFAKGNIAYLSHPLQCKDGTVIQVFCNGERYFDSSVRAFRSTIKIFEVL